MCIDNSKALQLVDENWGKDTLKKIGPSTYGCINVLLDYDEPIRLPKTDLEYTMETEFNLQPVVLSDNKTISCVICNLTEEVLSTDPETLKSEVIKQLVCTKTNEYSYRVGFVLERWKVVIRTIVGCFELTRTGSILRRIFKSCFMWYDV